MKWSLMIFLLAFQSVWAMPDTETGSEAVHEQDPLHHEIEAALIEKYFTKKPNQFLVDPQGFISAQQRKGIETLLNNHAVDSTIDLYLFVFGETQRLPVDGVHKDFANRHFSQGKPALLLYYYFGNPSRTEMVLSPEIAKAVSTSEQQRAAQSSSIRAMRATGSFEQLEEFVMQFSVRTYWMERMVDETQNQPVEEAAVVEKASPALAPKKRMDVLKMIPEKYRESLMIVAAAVGSVMVLWLLALWLRSRARYRFPEIEVETRLGGSHAAGIGAVVNFASPAISPANQREQVPEYLRRI